MEIKYFYLPNLPPQSLKYNKLKKKHPKNIFFHRTVSGLKKIDLYLKSSIFVLPSYYKTEAFPISIIEAMSTGNAIITTKHNYLPKIISKENGKLIKTKDSLSIYKAVVKLLNDKKKLKKIQNFNFIFSN